MCPHHLHTHHHRPKPWIGIVVVLVGIAALLGNLGLLPHHAWRTFWPVVLLVFGASQLLTCRGRSWSGAILTTLGLLYLGRNLGWWDVNVFAIFWPAVIIAFGLRLITGGRTRTRVAMTVLHGPTRDDGAPAGTDPAPGAPFAPPPATESAGEASAADTDSSSTIQESALLGGIDRRLNTQSFRGGQITAMLGGVQLDLRDCRMAGNEAHVETLAFMGGINLRVPRDWVVDSRLTAMLGGVNDRTAPPVEGAAKRLILTGNAILGGIEITN